MSQDCVPLPVVSSGIPVTVMVRGVTVYDGAAMAADGATTATEPATMTAAATRGSERFMSTTFTAG